MPSGTIPRHNPPGYPKVDELTDESKKLWSQTIQQWMEEEKKDCPQFFDGTITSFDTSQPGASIGPWIGFPGRITRSNPSKDTARMKAEETRANQDEYLEWSVERLSSNGKSEQLAPIKRVVFTCEGPEYWAHLAARQKDTIIALTKKLNAGNQKFDQNFSPNDLYPSGTYKTDNKWNRDTTTGTILHLIQEANNLNAEVGLAAQATVIRQHNGKIVTDEAQLIKCSLYGKPDRNSDPKIGSMVNTLARKGLKVSVKDPIGLYIHSFARDSFKLPYDDEKKEYSLSGSSSRPPPDGTFTFPRGDITKNMGLRIKVEIPPGTQIRDGEDLRQANVSDLQDEQSDNEHVKFGGHFAEYIQVHLYGIVIEGGKAETPQGCVVVKPADSAAEGVPTEAVPGKRGRYP